MTSRTASIAGLTKHQVVEVPRRLPRFATIHVTRPVAVFTVWIGQVDDL